MYWYLLDHQLLILCVSSACGLHTQKELKWGVGHTYSTVPEIDVLVLVVDGMLQ